MEILERNKTFINKYLGQRHTLPDEIRESLKGERIEVYGMADLNGDFRLCEEWLVLTGIRLFVYRRSGEDYAQAASFELAKVSSVRELNSLSATTLIFVAADDLPPLATVRYTHRQKIVMGQIKYIVESKIKEKEFNFGENYDADLNYQESILKPVVEAQNSVTNHDLGTLWRLISYLGPYKNELVWGAFGAILATIVALIPAYVSGRLIDQVVRPFQDGNIDLAKASEVAWIFVKALALTYLAREFFMWLRLNKMSVLGERVARDLRNELYQHLQTLSMDFYSKKQTGSIISRVSSDTDRIWDFIAFGVVEVSIAVITLVGLSAVLISMDWRLGLLMALPVPVLLFGIYLHGEKMKKMFLKAWRKWSDLTAVLSDTIPGIQVVKAFNQENRETARFNKRNSLVTAEFNNIHSAWTRFWPVLMLGIHAVIMSVWVFATPRLLSAEGSAAHLSAGTFVSFLLYMTMFAAPIEVIGQVARMLNRALSSAYRIFEVLDTRPSIRQSERAVNARAVQGEVTFKNVFFSYDGVRHVLKDMNFHVMPGEMVGLVGSSGGGKTTITKLIARFYDVNNGSIKIDGVDIRDLDLGKFRRQVGMVLQEPYLFHGSIWENIAYGIPDATKAQVIEAAKVANAHQFIGRLSHGYDTVVGERGHTLSGGERQRISIARAILANPRILILDEATSAVDTETERNIQEALDRLVKGRTVFAVAHRLSTLRKADRIFVIGKGSIVEEGTHAELLDKVDGEYRKLHKMQQEMSEFFAL